MAFLKGIIPSTLTLSCFFVIMLAPTLAFAEDVPNIDALLGAIADNNWPLVVAFALSILVFFVRKSTSLFPKKAVPYVVLTIALVSGAATGIIMQDGTWWHGLIKGLLEGLSAGLISMGWWSAGLKNILKLPKEK